MSPDFTAEQQAAIDRRDGRLLLSANAGSGKTSVLVERFVAMLIDDRIAPDAVLAVTFTDKAAGEMRARIRSLLIERGRSDLVPEAEDAWVSTLHGFCLRILQQHAIAVGLDPAFTILDEGEARQIRADAFGTALAALMRQGTPEVLDFAAAFGADPLQELTQQAYDRLRTRGQRRPRLPDVPPQPAADIAALRAAVAVAAEHLSGARDLATINKARSALAELQPIVAQDSPKAAQLSRSLPSPRSVAELKEGPYADALAAVASYCQCCRNLEAEQAIGHLDALLDGYGAAYEQAKFRASVVDWADLELLTRDLLRDNPAVCDSYRERFVRVMVDEFQDVNPLQLELLALIDNDNTFVVGDEFQSIYGFRYADVEVFRQWRAARDEAGEALVLPANFRSHPELLATLNVAFAPVHGESFAALERGIDSGHQFSGPRVELLITGTEDWDDEEITEGLASAKAWKAAEARLVAARVAELIDSKQFEARDFAVLLRATGDMGVFERALEERGIPTLANGGGGFWARRQILDLLAYLAAIANPRDEIALFSMLGSPLVGISSTGLAAIAEAGQGERWSYVDERGADLAKRLSAADAAALERFKVWFGPLRKRAPLLAVDELIEFALTDLGYDLHTLGLPAGRRRFANLLKLQRLAAGYESRNGRDIRGFIDRARAELEAEAREPEAPVELGEADAVQLMTMHASKGLQFGVVICADLGRPSNTQVPALLVDGDRIGLRLSSLLEDSQPTLDFDALKEEMRERELAEQQRLLYVAMTRAEELLILSGGVKLAEWPNMGPKASPLTWVAPAILPGVEALLDGDAVSEVATQASGHDGRVRLVVSTPDRVGELIATRDSDRQLELAVRDGAPALLTTTAPQVAPPGVPERLSYTALAGYARCPYSYYLQRVLRLPEVDPGELAPPATSPAGMDARIRGSIVHELLEQLDLRDPALPAPDTVREVASGYEIEIDDAGVTECLALVSAFIGGPLAPRLRQAEEIHAERGFSFALDAGDGPAPLVNGFIDVIAFEPGGGALVIDYKTDAVADDEDLEAQIATSYSDQRAIYALAALRGGANTVEVTHLFLNRPEEPATARFMTSDIAALESQVRDQAAGLLAGDFAPTDTPHRGLCATCPGRAALCSHGPEMTERVLPS